MLDRILKGLLSTRLTAILLILFAIAIGAATIVETLYSTAASKQLIYNTKWLEFIYIILTINMIGNIFKYKMYRKEKISVFLFHISFIVIMLGAGITRYIGFEGSMRIREGESSNLIISSDTYLQFKVDNQEMQYVLNKALFLNTVSNYEFDYEFDFEGNEIRLAYNDYFANTIDTVVQVENGSRILELVTAGKNGRESVYVEEGTTSTLGSLPVSFNTNEITSAVQIWDTDSGLFVMSPYDLSYMTMQDQTQGTLNRDSLQEFPTNRLYMAGQDQLVFKAIHEDVELQAKSVTKKQANGEDILRVDLTCNDETRTIDLYGGSGYVSQKTIFQISGLTFNMSYGSKYDRTPFAVQLNDFEMEKYPGSGSPSSYSSKVTVLDERDGGHTEDYHIYMNHILDYDGYRFFQSSYDPDELGTILSVNHDWWGTMITYFGYLLMSLAMLLTFVSRKSRFVGLIQKVNKLSKERAASLILLFILSAFSLDGIAQEENQNLDEKQKIENYKAINADHAELFSQLLTQDLAGRIKPIHTLASELMRKVTKRQNFMGLSPTQVMLGMMQNPGHWQSIHMIQTKSKDLAKKYGAIDNKFAFNDFFTEEGKYLLADDVSAAHAKKPSKHDTFDKAVLAVDERLNICYMIYEGSILRIFPKEGEENNKWFVNTEFENFEDESSFFVKSGLTLYMGSIDQAYKTNSWGVADSTLQYLVSFQNKFGSEVIPEKSVVDIEIVYNKVTPFFWLLLVYAIIGFISVILLFVDILASRKWITKLVNGFSVILFITFILHAVALGMRWYISGHAPWSNAYEALLFIGWATILAGFLFSRASKMPLATTAVLTALFLFVAQLNWLNPEITPLVPVLKSYWLMIHVAVITASYGFLGLGALLGFFSMVLTLFLKEGNQKRVKSTIYELTYINELTVTVGVFTAAIGTFLGGVWANESWGRYWGWDSKETWALVIVLVYGMILHFRFIPGLQSKYTFNLSSLLSYSTVLMTFFGVNYYLTGLHSYAGGEAPPIPPFTYYSVVIILIVGILSYKKSKKFRV